MTSEAGQVESSWSIKGKHRGHVRSKTGEQPAAHRHRAMTWAQRLKRVFVIEIKGCRRCGGKLKVIASIEEPDVIARILGSLGHATNTARSSANVRRVRSRRTASMARLGAVVSSQAEGLSGMRRSGPESATTCRSRDRSRPRTRARSCGCDRRHHGATGRTR